MMRASKFTDAQKAFIIKQGEAGIPASFSLIWDRQPGR